jgi:hypothetical protein
LSSGFPLLGLFVDAETGAAENVRILCVHLLVVVIGPVICGIFPKTPVPTGIVLPTGLWNKAGYPDAP